MKSRKKTEQEILEHEKLNYQSWFSNDPNAQKQNEVCYVKVLIENAVDQYVQAVSYMGKFSSSDHGLGPGSPYGVRTDCSTDKELQAICLEAKHPGQISHHNPTHIDDWDFDLTNVTVLMLDKITTLPTCRIADINANYPHIWKKNEQIATIKLVDIFYGNHFGIYCVNGQASQSDAKVAGLHQCMTETPDIVTDPEKLPDEAETNSYAVKFDCA